MKLLIVGLDGVSPVLVDRWIDRLPNLRSLMDAGVHGTLESIVPPASVPAWQCFATGKNPAKIGLWGFATIGPDRKLVRGRTSSKIGCLWDLCSRQGLRVGVLNVPGTFPPYPLNGFMVSGFPVPPGRTWAYPADVMKRLDRAVGGYEVDVPLTKPSDMRGGGEAYLRQVERLHRKSVESAQYLVKSYHPDFFMTTLQGVDMVEHDFWRYMGKPESPYSGVIETWYVKVDQAVGELRKLAGPDAYFLVLSDHGSMPVSASFHVNEFLRAQGLLSLRHGTAVKRRGSNYTKIRESLMRNLPPEVIKAVYDRAPDFIAHRLTASAKVERILTQLIDNVDWDRTRIFSTGGVQANFYLNPDATDNGGGEKIGKARLLARLTGLLEDLRHPTTGEALREVFHYREETFPGPYQVEAPDLCVEFFTSNEKVHVNPGLGTGKLWSFAPHLSAEHVRAGFWAFTGPRVRRGVRLDASILDLAPTLLELLDVNGPGDYDGRVLREAFVPS
jgi:predicted AlkP superfamily phosphohydrolase/phosphomutase